MFDATEKLSEKQIKSVIISARIPRFTDGKVEIKCEGNVLSFVIDNRMSGSKRHWMMVESGIQQQAIGLVCAALGVGIVFRGQGKDGTAISENDIVTVKARLDAMKASYEEGAFWSSAASAGKKDWVSGNLPDPVRNGGKALGASLSEVRTANEKGINATRESVSQLLWAARGRTPHFYKSRQWGMTIPTAHGRQNFSCVYLISENTLYRYVNWHNNRPTNSLELLGEIELDLHKQLLKLFPLKNCFIVIGKNETSGIALWEVGYQLLNLLLQAHALGVAYHSALFDETHKTMLGRVPIKGPVAIVALKWTKCRHLV